MKISQHSSWLWRPAGVTVIASMTLPFLMAGCGSKQEAPAPTQSGSSRASNPSMSGKQKLTLLAGAAAVYFLYRKFQRDNAARIEKTEAATNKKVQYYRSKKGGYIYYNDENGNAVKVAPAQTEVQPLNVSPDGYDYSKFQGYNNQRTGQNIEDVFQTP